MEMSDSGAIIHQETSDLTLSCFFSYPSPSTHMANDTWASHLLIPSCCLFFFILVVMANTLFGPKYWDKVKGHSCATEVFVFPLMIYREFCSRHARGRITVQLNSWGGQPNTTQLHFPASLQSLFWVGVGFWLDVCRFWCLFSKGKWKKKSVKAEFPIGFELWYKYAEVRF